MLNFHFIESYLAIADPTPPSVDGEYRKTLTIIYTHNAADTVSNAMAKAADFGGDRLSRSRVEFSRLKRFCREMRHHLDQDALLVDER